MDYEIEGFKITKSELSNPRYRFIEYSKFLCKIVVATDDMGTQICFNGCFFGPWFLNLEHGVKYLRENIKNAERVFKKVYIDYLKYKILVTILGSRLYFRLRYRS
jgi:hypothetical protein